ncbi:hypothetical protein C8Q80DRAFT_1213609 [Daedaleopsis nitida]|nr:hypothetical protein C8Q80DRAFT_1214940 [Daedaleopsis nitida]KAI0737317.1 hypothetical protein C8Q80DRAFT_1213609 [Daedaleopsis nitida]
MRGRTMKGKQLKQCAGGCPPELKPSYCSKRCQRKDWDRHKAICVKLPREVSECDHHDASMAGPAPPPILTDGGGDCQ